MVGDTGPNENAWAQGPDKICGTGPRSIMAQGRERIVSRRPIKNYSTGPKKS